MTRPNKTFYSADQLFFDGMVGALPDGQRAKALVYSTALNKESKYGEQLDGKREYLHDLTRENLDKNNEEKQALDYCLKAFQLHWGTKRTEEHPVKLKTKDVVRAKLPATVDDLQTLLESSNLAEEHKEQEGTDDKGNSVMTGTDWITTTQGGSIIHSNIRSCMQTVTLGPDD